MKKNIKNMDSFLELFEKLKYSAEKYGASYTAMMFDIVKKERLSDFGAFLLKHSRISDDIFVYSNTRFLVILEETTLRGALLFNERLREKIKQKGFKYKFYCSALQGNFVDDPISLERGLKKRLKKAKEYKTTNCVHSLSYID